VWGFAALHRQRGWFGDRDASLLADVGGYIGQGIRRAILATALAADGAAEPPGLILVAADGSAESVTPAARRWLGELVDSTSEAAALPLVLVSVAGKARRAGTGQADEVASVRLPTRNGGWLLVHASLLDPTPTAGSRSWSTRPASPSWPA
jgi:hypothetical protein